jgi:predicted transposase YbfD/YdcC
MREPALGLDPRDTKVGLILAHVDIDEKSNEIPAAQRLLGELHAAHGIITLDALHCQKKPSKLPRKPGCKRSSN